MIYEKVLVDKRKLERDEVGWRIPRLGTFSRQIYRLTKEGSSSAEIARVTGKSINTVRVLKCKFQHPERY